MPVSVGLNLNIVSPSAVPIVVHIKSAHSNAGQDFNYTNPTVITFGPNQTEAFFSVQFIDDATIELPESVSFVLRPGAGAPANIIGVDSIFTLNISDNDEPGAFFPTYTIAVLRGNNTTEGGAADSTNVVCKINGTLYGPNLRGVNNGIQFTIREATGGIHIFKSSSNFGLTLQEGDSVRAIGKVTHFNGLSQLNLDSIVKLVGNQV